MATVQFWVARAKGQRLERVAWEDRSHAPRVPKRTAPAIEKRVLAIRRQLRDGPLGEVGAEAIHRELRAQGVKHLPSMRTIGRILERHGALDGRRRIRRPPPPHGWYLPEVAGAKAELDFFDVVEGLKIKDGPLVDTLTAIALHGSLADAWPSTRVTAADVVEAMVTRWRAVGLPRFAQFDNDTRFQGPHQYPDTFGRVIRLCLSLEVIPVFAPPRETGFQADIESFNGRWQGKVWRRFLHASLPALQKQSRLYIAATRQRHAVRIAHAPDRRPFPKSWSLNLQAPLHGKIIYLRRTDDQGRASFLGQLFAISSDWVRRLVRAEVNLNTGIIHVYTLRRREPTSQPCITRIRHRIPEKPFAE